MRLVRDLFGKIYSGENLLKLTGVRYLPRWVILMIDVGLSVFSLACSMLLLNFLKVKILPTISIFEVFVIIVGINTVFMYGFKTFSGIIRHSTIIDMVKLFFACACTLVALIVINSLSSVIYGEKLFLDAMIVLYFAFSFISLFLFRVVVKESFVLFRDFKSDTEKQKLLVVGIGDESVAVAQTIIGNPSIPYTVAGFITDRTDSYAAKVLGKPIYLREETNTHNHPEIEDVLVIEDIFEADELDKWVEYCLAQNWKVLKAPAIRGLRDGDQNINIRTLQIEDLLNRKPIKMEEEPVREQHKDKNILITGGAGSIGSELVRQVAQFNPSLIVIVDQAETPLYDIELEMREKYPHLKFKFILGDISNQRRMSAIFKEYRFWIVYHAAAYKHVPMIEENPREAVLVNIMGTKIISRLACEHGVSRFVMISTDKAVNPTNVMGASKRAAELFVQSFQNREGCRTKFITTRFGNVLGSNGSVIPHFRQQIEKGGPVTVTHPEIVRYFMTIPEACQLVLQAGTMGKGGEIFVFDMGKPVKILDLAKRMIKLSGYIPEQDIRIVYTGLRPGEKLYEELLSDNTKNMPTPNKKIMVSKDPTMEFEAIDRLSRHIIRAALREDKMEVVRQLKKIVPEYKSNNSEFEVLDRKTKAVSENGLDTI